jgi:hypothetical protein
MGAQCRGQRSHVFRALRPYWHRPNGLMLGKVTSTTLVGSLQRYVGNPIVAAILRSPAHGLLSRSVGRR